MKTKMITWKKSNCLLFALYMFYYHGGYLVIRRTRLNKLRWLVWFHVLWLPEYCNYTNTPCTNLLSFSPDQEIKKSLPPMIFKGSVKKGD